MLALLILGATQLTDAELDEIAARHSWPTTEAVDKMRGSVVHRGVVPRKAAAETFAAFMVKNGIPASERAGFDWYSAELDLGFRTTEIEWTAAGTVGRETDLKSARRKALRGIEAAAARMLADFEKTIAPKPEKAVAEIAQVVKKKLEVGKSLETLRELMQDPSADEEKLGAALQDYRNRRRELSARREALAQLVTRREEARLVLRGVLE